jgi:hypothetical protein
MTSIASGSLSTVSIMHAGAKRELSTDPTLVMQSTPRSLNGTNPPNQRTRPAKLLWTISLPPTLQEPVAQQVGL